MYSNTIKGNNTNLPSYICEHNKKEASQEKASYYFQNQNLSIGGGISIFR